MMLSPLPSRANFSELKTVSNSSISKSMDGCRNIASSRPSPDPKDSAMQVDISAVQRQCMSLSRARSGASPENAKSKWAKARKGARHESDFHQRSRPQGRGSSDRKQTGSLLRKDRLRNDRGSADRRKPPRHRRLMISKKLCGVKISLCRERGFILHIIFIMIPTNLRYFCLATFFFLESPVIPDSLKYFFS